MLRIAMVTHSLRCAVAVTALAGLGSSTVRAQSLQAQTQVPARPPEPAPASPTDLFLFDHWLSTRPQSVTESWLRGIEMKCIGCGGFDAAAVRPEPTNATAPWALYGRWRRQTTLGVVSTGFIGVRNYALPLSTAIPLGGDFDPRALSTSGTSVFAPVTQWSLTAAVEKTLAKRANGASVGVTADMLVPLKTETIGVGDPRISALTSATFRFGIIFRW
jgi:hypothetical protein